MVARTLGHSRDERTPVRDGRYLSARTWTGDRCLDLRDLRSVRAKRIVSGSILKPHDYLILCDRRGVSVTISKPDDFALIRSAVMGGHQGQGIAALRVSLAARYVLGLKPLPALASLAWRFMAAMPMLVFMCGYISVVLVCGGR
jgi:hypothetical protein